MLARSDRKKHAQAREEDPGEEVSGANHQESCILVACQDHERVDQMRLARVVENLA